MRLSIILVYFILPFCGTNAQGWYHEYNESNKDWIVYVTELENNKYTIIGGFKDDPFDFHYYKATLDSVGNIIQKVDLELPQLNNLIITEAIIDSSDSFTIAGHFYDTDNKGQFVLIRLDDHGKIQWWNEYGTDKSDSFVKVIQTTDGGFLLGGRSTVSESVASLSDRDCYVVKTDSEGVLEWELHYGLEGQLMHESVLDLYEENNTFYAVSDYFISGTNNNMNIASISADGQLIELIKLKEGFLMQTIRTLDGNYVTKESLGNTFISPPTYNQVIYKHNKNGDLQWTTNYDYIGYQYSSHITQTKDDGFVLAMDGIIDGFPDYHLFILKIDKHGNVQWIRPLLEEKLPRIHNIIATKTGCIIFGISDIYESINDDYDAFILKIDEDYIPTKVSDLLENVVVFPNPVNNKILIFKSSKDVDQIVVYNNMGRRLAIYDPVSDFIKLPNYKGICIVEFSIGNQLLRKKVVIY